MIKILRENNKIKQMPLDCITGATLLSYDEAMHLLTQEERTCKGPIEKIKNKTYISEDGYINYWLRDGGNCDYNACVINKEGGFSNFSVRNDDTGVRPTLILNLKSSNLKVDDRFEFGGYTFRIISYNLAICDVAIDVCPFNKNRNYGNYYKTSYIKARVDDWFESAKNEMSQNEKDGNNYESNYIKTDIDDYLDNNNDDWSQYKNNKDHITGIDLTDDLKLLCPNVISNRRERYNNVLSFLKNEAKPGDYFYVWHCSATDETMTQTEGTEFKVEKTYEGDYWLYSSYKYFVGKEMRREGQKNEKVKREYVVHEIFSWFRLGRYGDCSWPKS